MRKFLLLFIMYSFSLKKEYEAHATSPLPENTPVTMTIDPEGEIAFREFLKDLASSYASEREREELIRKGLLRTFNKKSEKRLASATLDCMIKELAYEFTQRLLPGRTTELKNVFDGLELGAVCNITFKRIHPSMEPVKQHNKFNNEESLGQSQERQVYVHGAFGQNHYNGTKKYPLKDIQSGINKCAMLNNRISKGCTVLIRAGVYELSKPLLIKENSISLNNYKGEIVTITSDKVVNIHNWKLYKKSMERFQMINPMYEGIQPKKSTRSIVYIGKFSYFLDCENYCSNSNNCTSYAYFGSTTGAFANQCYARVDGMWNTVKHSGVVSGKKVVIYSADLTDFQLSKFDQIFVNGRRAVRARFPNANPEIMGLHTIPTGYVPNASKWLPPYNKPDPVEIHIESPLRHTSLFQEYFLGIDGTVEQFNPPKSYWGVKNPNYGSMYKVPSGLSYSDDLEMNSRPWKDAATGIVHCFPDHHWGNWIFKLDSRDEVNKTLHWTSGGFQEARGSTAGKEWYVENIFEELDSANEWFYDENSRVLYYSPNGTDGGLPSVINIPQLPSLLTISGNQYKPVKNVSIKGLKFQHTTQTFLEPYMVPSGGDWSVHRNGAVYIEGSEGVTIQGCKFDSPGGNGLFVSNYNRNTVISNNVFFRLGENGIVLVGETNLMDGTIGNQPRGTQILYNVVFENGVWVKQTYAFVQSLACGTHLEGNVFFNGPRGGININDGFGGGNSMENNLLFNFVRETHDHGPINTWDRVPYLTRVYDDESVSLQVQQNSIHRNFLINNYWSVYPIDHDDGSSFWNDTHNYIVYGGFKNYLGHDLHSIKNVYVYPKTDCLMTVGQKLGQAGYGDVYEQNTCIAAHTKIYWLGSCTPSLAKSFIPYLEKNRYYTPNGTITTQCGSETWNLASFQMHGFEYGSLVKELVGDDVVIQWGKELLGL